MVGRLLVMEGSTLKYEGSGESTRQEHAMQRRDGAQLDQLPLGHGGGAK